MTPGIYHDLSGADYHRSAGISKSGLDLIARSPAHYKHVVVKETPAMRLGSAIHCAVLEPERWPQAYRAIPEGLDRRTKAGKEVYAELEASGSILLSIADWETCERIRDAVRSHYVAGALLTEGQAETSAFWTDEMSGELCKCRPDFVAHGSHRLIVDGCVLVDIKTTTDASSRGFSRSVANFRYHVQAAFYSDGWAAASGRTAEAFAFVAVEKEPPYAVAVYELDAEAIAQGRRLYQRDLSVYAACKALDDWPCYPDEIQSLSLPAWAWEE